MTGGATLAGIEDPKCRSGWRIGAARHAGRVRREAQSRVRATPAGAGVASRLKSEGYDPVGSSPTEMAATIKTESAMWAKVMAAGIHAD